MQSFHLQEITTLKLLINKLLHFQTHVIVLVDAEKTNLKSNQKYLLFFQENFPNLDLDGLTFL